MTVYLTCSNKECNNHCANGYWTTYGNCPDCKAELTEWKKEWPVLKTSTREIEAIIAKVKIEK